MKLHEYQSKQLFSKYGIPIPKGRVAATAGEARQIAEELGGRVVIKSQVLVGGRGKAGGVKLANNPQEAEQLASRGVEPEVAARAVEGSVRCSIEPQTASASTPGARGWGAIEKRLDPLFPARALVGGIATHRYPHAPRA